MGREALTLPKRCNLFRELSKSYRKRCGVGLKDSETTSLETSVFQAGEMSSRFKSCISHLNRNFPRNGIEITSKSTT